MIVGVSGFGSTGSGAVMDYLREFEEISAGGDMELSFLYDPNIKKADNPCVHYTEVISLISGFESLRGRTSFPFSFVKIAYFLFCVNFVIYSNISFTSDSSILHFSAICAIVQPFCDN